MDWFHNQDRQYKDEPIRFRSGQTRIFTPKEYRKMRSLAFGPPFANNSEAKIFYLQARYMEHFEDDFPCDHEVQYYFPTYQSLSTPELRGYFTWRTRLRHGQLEKTSLSYAYLYLYELLHQIGAATEEEGLENLLWFYEHYNMLDPRIRRYARQWIADYAIYYGLPVESVRDFVNLDFDEALTALNHCDSVSDEELLPAILQLSSYHLEKSRAWKQYPEELTFVICKAYRRLNERYARRYERPYSQKLYKYPIKGPYYPFHSAVFYDRKRFDHYEYRVSPIQRYFCDGDQWRMERDYTVPVQSPDLGTFVHAADRLAREAYGVKPPLKTGSETKTMMQFISEAITEQKKSAAPKIEFDLSQLSSIRRSSEAIGQKLMTEEERYVPENPFSAGATPSSPKSQSYAETTPWISENLPYYMAPAPAQEKKVPAMAGQTALQNAAAREASAPQEEGSTAADLATAQEKEASDANCVLSGDALRFMQIMLYGGDLKGFLAETHQMVSVLAESVNEQLYDEFADTVIEFDGNTPVLVEDYLDDLKGMIPG
ncbi:MAG: TerB N-terminal domain-containing protein [Lachnospiraceae bacterium]|nr:TerB N-terminal domain-containing protein [Lachnospiraceae bacterium]